MTFSSFETDEIHPIDIIEQFAELHEWDFDRLSDDQIAMAIEGQWRTYSATLAWSPQDQTLRMILTFEIAPPDEKLSYLYETINLANDQIWIGSFTYWKEQQLMVYRYGLLIGKEQNSAHEQIDTMLGNARIACEQFCPVFQLVCWGDDTPERAMNVAISKAYGHA